MAGLSHNQRHRTLWVPGLTLRSSGRAGSALLLGGCRWRHAGYLGPLGLIEHVMLPIPATQSKLSEAEFFFRNLRAIDRKTFSPEPESFGYYLSAFVSAGRSVTLALQSEHKQEYDSWFPAWLESLTDEECALLEQFNTHRIATIHKQGIEVSYRWEEMSQSDFLLAAATEGVNIQMFRGPPGIAAIRSQRPVRTFAASGNESQVTETASGYLRLLQRMVVEFASHFANAA